MALTGSASPENSHRPRGLPPFSSLLYLVPFSCLLFRSFSFNLSLSGRSYCSLYTCILSLLMGGIEFRVFLLCYHLGPPQDYILSKLFSISVGMNFTKGKDSFFWFHFEKVALIYSWIFITLKREGWKKDKGLG